MTERFVVLRTSDPEKNRTHDLLMLTPERGVSALDIGARDGYFSKLLAERFDHVVALDLERPDIDHPRVDAVKGNVCQLDFKDNAFDLVFCSEVLEHIPPHLLQRACNEITRVARDFVVIGVPYRQDIRVGRTTCQVCGRISPPWGHVNSFDEDRLTTLFKELTVAKVSYVGTNTKATNAISAALMDFAGNPYGTYDQDERCLSCDSKLMAPTYRSLLQKGATRAATILNFIQSRFSRPRANWIHIRFEKK